MIKKEHILVNKTHNKPKIVLLLFMKANIKELKSLFFSLFLPDFGKNECARGLETEHLFYEALYEPTCYHSHVYNIDLYPTTLNLDLDL